MDVRTPVGRLIPEIRGEPTAEVPIELLLAHRAGLQAHLPLYAPLVFRREMDVTAAILEAARARRPISKKLEPESEGFEPLYSDLGYILAGIALARFASAIDAGDAMRKITLEPLGLEIGSARDLEREGIDLARRAAPTEDVAWRGGVLRGRVHDENAWALTGLGASGHAGLFGTIGGVAALASHFLRERERLSWMTRERPGGTLRAGFDGKSAQGSSAGTILGPKTFGHLGFTGTSMWIDPEAKIGVVLLTNRVHPTRTNDSIRAARPRAHDDLAAFALSGK
jgi:CubicO group peptidase (beta-lactamase class C family)